MQTHQPKKDKIADSLDLTPIVNEKKEVGSYEVNFDASKLSSGVYIYQLNVNEFINTKKMVLLK